MHVLFGGEKFENEKFTTNHSHKIFIFKSWRMRLTEPEGLNDQHLGGGKPEGGIPVSREG